MSKPFLYKKFICPKENKIAEYTLSFRILENGNRVFYKMCRNIWCMNLFLDHIEPSMRKKEESPKQFEFVAMDKEIVEQIEKEFNLVKKPVAKFIDGHIVLQKPL